VSISNEQAQRNFLHTQRQKHKKNDKHRHHEKPINLPHYTAFQIGRRIPKKQLVDLIKLRDLLKS